ncbi:putative pre-mRNA-splicing factor ATP-dependent RNA helicase DHX16 [Cydia strobilella]|uniref:putative pre-mRNA-splicing factor ATP-dependent RNA helicase DHX16 n=1 Tax=Cydia strobilella TaxID=1100964 RepID=UPI0030060881
MCRVGSYSNMEFILLLSILSLSLALPSQVSDPPARPNCIKMSPEKEQQIDQIVAKLEQFLNNLTIEHEHFDIRLLKLSIEQHTEDEEEKETVLQLSVNDCQLSDDDLEEIDHHREKAKLEREKEAVKEKARKEKEAELKKEQQSDNSKKQDHNLNNVHENKNKSDNNKKQDQIPSKKIEQENNKNSQAHEATEIDTEQVNQVNQGSVNKPEAGEQKHGNLKNNGIVKQENQVAKAEANDQEDDKFKNKDRDLENNGKEEEQLNNIDKEVRPEVIHLDLDDNGQKIVEALGRKEKDPIIVYVQKRNSGQSEYWFPKRR